MDDSLREFAELLAHGKEGPGGSIDLLLAQLDSRRADEVRLCAIPYQVDESTIAALLPEEPSAELAAVYARLAGISFVLPATAGTLVLHEHARAHLFNAWLTGERVPEFRAASARLAAHFAHLASAGLALTVQAADSARVYHLIGADSERGFEDFDELVRKRFRHYRLSECSALLARVHDYDPILSSAQSQIVRYHEASLAADLSDEVEAQQLLEELLAQPATPELELRARKRLGLIHSSQRRWQDALAELNKALGIAQNTPALKDLVDDVLHDVGCARRDMGDVGGAEEAFRRCIALAEKQGDTATLAIAYDSLGTLWQRLGDATRAITMFERSLEYLRSNAEPFRPAQVYNNLAMAHAELRNWEKAEEMLNGSLGIKRAAGDTRGQAVALANLMRVHLNLRRATLAVDVAQEATALFCQVKDLHGAARVQVNLGRLFETLGDSAKAQSAFAQADEFFERAGVSTRSARPPAPRRLPAFPTAWRRIVGFAVVGSLLVLLLYLGRALFG